MSSGVRSWLLFSLCIFVICIAQQGSAECTKLSLLELVDMIGGPLFRRWPCGSNSIIMSCANCPAGDYSSAVVSARDEWKTASTHYSFVDATYGGTVIWHSGPWPSEYNDPEVPAGYAEVGWDVYGYVNSATIYINDDDYDFSDVGESGLVDFESVVLHEIGHVLGLVNAGCYSVMSTLTIGQVRRTLLDLDEEAIAYLYCCGAGNLVLADGNLSQLVTTCDGNPAAETSGLKLESGTLSWQVWDERDTQEFLVEGLHTLDGPGVILGRDGGGVGTHAIQLPVHGFPYLRLVEVERGGRRSICDVTSAHPSTVIDQFDAPANKDDLPLEATDPLRESPPLGETVVIYTHESLLTPVLALRDYWEDMGCQAFVYWFPHFLSDESDLREDIAFRAQNGVKYFHIVGGWSDYFAAADLWGSTPYWQAKRDNYLVSGRLQRTPDSGASIPPILSPDGELGPVNTARSRPYVFSDHGYADVDGDGSPDVVVTRWPATTSAQVETLVSKVTSYGAALATGTRRADRTSFFVHDVTTVWADGEESAGFSSLVAEALLQTAPAQLTTTFLTSEHLSDYITTSAAHLNAWNPDLVVLMGTASQCDQPGGFFTKFGSPPWSMSLLNAGTQAALVVAGSCSAADYTTPCNQFAQPVCNDFLFTASKGALAWLGPTTGSWQAANYVVERFLVEEMFQNPYRPMAESWLVAMQRAYDAFGTESDYLLTLDSYVFLGDPLSPFSRLPSTAIVSRVRHLDGTQAAMPAVFAIGCPQGDFEDSEHRVEEIAVEVTLDATDVLRALNPDALTLSQPVNGSVTFLSNESLIVADSATVLVPQSNQHRTTFTLGSCGGCGIDSALVSLYGLPLGYAKIHVRSPDYAPPYGSVNIQDFAFFVNGYPVNPAINDCRDINNDGLVSTVDFSYFTSHYPHAYPGGGSAPQEVAVANASVALRMTEEYLTATTHRLYVDVDVENFGGVTTSLFALARDNERLVFVDWLPAANPPGTVLFASKMRGGLEHLFVGMGASEPLSGSTVNLGRLVFDVTGSQPFQISNDDFALMVGEVLLEDAGGVSQVAQMSGLMGRTLDPAVARIYHNRLEQNFPNPFNPTTTLAFSLKNGGEVSLTIYDVAGRRVRELVNERRDRGAYKVTWDGQNDTGQIVASGVYFYKLVAASFTDTKKMTILK